LNQETIAKLERSIYDGIQKGAALQNDPGDLDPPIPEWHEQLQADQQVYKHAAVHLQGRWDIKRVSLNDRLNPPMRLVYIAGPYRAETEAGVRHNVWNASIVAERVWKLGACAVCPHLNTAFFGGIVEDQAFLDGDIELLKRCDAVMLVAGWARSTGTQGEVKVAQEEGIPVFQDIVQLGVWLEGQK
jgi:hypothetical protein